MVLALFLWKLSVDMKVLDALVPTIRLSFDLWMQVHLGFF
jgi:hypothetical protein